MSGENLTFLASIRKYFIERCRLPVDLNCAGLRLREEEEVADQAVDLIGQVDDLPQDRLVLRDGLVFPPKRHFSFATNNGEGSAQFVRDVREELRAQLVEGRQFLMGSLERFLGRFSLSDVFNAAPDPQFPVLLDQVAEQTNRHKVAGVSLDEELVNLLKYQRAFEAASRMIVAADEMMSTLISLKR